MCIMMTPHEPSSTRLINIPVIFNNRKSFLLTYTNDLEVGQTTFRPPQTSLPLMGQPLFQNNTSTGSAGLMIVPIPNPNKDKLFALVSTSDPQLKSFRHQVHSLGESLMAKYMSMGMYKKSRSYSMNSFDDADTIEVVRVGNYDISIAPTFEDLDRINWNHFDLPADFERRRATLRDQTLYPMPMAYVVAKAVQSIKDDGFGVIYPDPGYIYFPTAHEDNGGFHKYDVLCYDFSDKSRYYKFNVSGNCIYSDEKYMIPAYDNYSGPTILSEADQTKIKNVLSKLPLGCSTNTGNQSSFKIDDSRINVMNLVPVGVSTANQNIWIKTVKPVTQSRSVIKPVPVKATRAPEAELQSPKKAGNQTDETCTIV